MLIQETQFQRSSTPLPDYSDDSVLDIHNMSITIDRTVQPGILDNNEVVIPRVTLCNNSSSRSSADGYSSGTIVIGNQNGFYAPHESRNIDNLHFCVNYNDSNPRTQPSNYDSSINSGTYILRSSLSAVHNDSKPRILSPDCGSPVNTNSHRSSLPTGLNDLSFRNQAIEYNSLSKSLVEKYSDVSISKLSSVDYDDPKPRTPTPDYDYSSRSSIDGYQNSAFIIEDQEEIYANIDSRNKSVYSPGSSSVGYDDSKQRASTPDHNSSLKSLVDGYSNTTFVTDDQDNTFSFNTAQNMSSCFAEGLSADYDDSVPRIPTPDYDSSQRSSAHVYSNNNIITYDQDRISESIICRNMVSCFDSSLFADLDNRLPRTPTPDYSSSTISSAECADITVILKYKEDCNLGTEFMNTWNSHYTRKSSVKDTFYASVSVSDRDGNTATDNTQASKNANDLSDGSFTVNIKPRNIREDTVVRCLPTFSSSFTNPTYMENEEMSEISTLDGRSDLSSFYLTTYGINPEVIPSSINSEEEMSSISNSRQSLSHYYEIDDDNWLERFGRCGSSMLCSWLFLSVFIAVIMVLLICYFPNSIAMWMWLVVIILVLLAGMANCIPAKLRRYCKDD